MKNRSVGESKNPSPPVDWRKGESHRVNQAPSQARPPGVTDSRASFGNLANPRNPVLHVQQPASHAAPRIQSESLSAQFEKLRTSEPPESSAKQKDLGGEDGVEFKTLEAGFDIYSRADRKSRHSVLNQIDARKDIDIEVLPENHQQMKAFTDANVGGKSFFSKTPQGRADLANAVASGQPLNVTVGVNIDYKTKTSRVAHALNHEISGHVKQVIGAYDEMKSLVRQKIPAAVLDQKVARLQHEANFGVHASIARLDKGTDEKTHLMDEINSRMLRQVGRHSDMAREIEDQFDDDIDLQDDETKGRKIKVFLVALAVVAGQ